ncbi:MAG: IclR family transcriptional regulator [Bifidobacteriaceae bacterium]|jgi:DNA-binding IclR family transcriptional regulator|nr:IclR family transcriptional regulator [Bifidobacteriaceae bacterium]
MANATPAKLNGDTPVPNVAVDRSLRILEAFLGDKTDLGVLELSRLLGLDKSVVHRVLLTMVGRGFLEQDPNTRRYRVGLRSWELGRRYRVGEPIKLIAEREIEAMVARYPYSTGFTSEFSDGDMIILTCFMGPGPMNVSITPGIRLMAETTTTGKVWLAHLDPSEAEQIIMQRRKAYTGTPLPALTTLMAELADIRERGYEAAQGAFTPSIATVATVVRDPSGTLALGLSVDYLLSDQTVGLGAALPPDLLACARAIERAATASPPVE